MNPWHWILFGLLGLVVLGILFDTWRYHRAAKSIIGLLQQYGPLTGLELSCDHGVPRSHVYLILNRLERDGKIEKCKPKNPVYEKQEAWRVKCP